MDNPLTAPAVWPCDHLQPALPLSPSEPHLVALHSAVSPLRPFLRGERYESELWADREEAQPQARATLCIGPHADYLSIVVRPGEVFVDLPLGHVPQHGSALGTLLHLNTVRAWKFRVDSVASGQALVVLEGRLDTADLTTLPTLVLEALMERTLLQATLHALKERSHA